MSFGSQQDPNHVLIGIQLLRPVTRMDCEPSSRYDPRLLATHSGLRHSWCLEGRRAKRCQTVVLE
eukprot:2964227-Pyramimonas_sp.AAC.1